jgi:phosphonate transport system substrate-binding protein
MKQRAVIVLLLVVMLSSGLMVGCAKAPAQIGSTARPIQLYFVPSVDTSVIVASGEKIASYLKEQTGLEFKVSVPTSYAATIEAMGVAKGDAMGFIPAQGYVLANQKYGVQVGLATVRYGNSWYATEYIVRADSGITSLKDLEGKKWAMPSVTSTSGYLYPLAQLKREGITPGEQVEAGGHPQVVLAVYNGQVDFGTVFFSPPGNPGDWKWGDPPDPAGDIHLEEVNGATQAFIGDYQLRDARCNVLGDYPDVIEQVKIISLSDQIPNDTVSFVKDFPEDLKTKIIDGLIAYATSDAGQEVLANKDFYDITGFEKVPDTFYDPVRNLIKQLGITEDDILK